MDKRYISITALTKYLKVKFDSDEHLQLIYLRGEISNFKSHTSGHFYFSLKDEQSKINAVMFKTNTQRLRFRPMDGMKVLVVGHISVYEATGNYQIYIEDMQEDGIGNLYIAFEQLKEKLSREGLFQTEHKKVIPRIPTRIGIITAPTGAAIQDILSTIKRRFPMAETYLFPSLVQGEKAKEDLVKKIKQAQLIPLDVLIIGRGGGSIEDLWPFNEEIVARAIYECSIPTISAVGHEIDYTICDYVADLRAPTPTGAAELAVPSAIDLIHYLKQLEIRLGEAITKKINYLSLHLDSIKNSFVIKSPLLMYENKKQKLDLLQNQITQLIYHKVKNQQKRLEYLQKNYLLLHPEQLFLTQKKDLMTIIEKLELINPLSVLKRGYTVSYQNDHLIDSIKNIEEKKQLKVQFYDGYVITEIKEMVGNSHEREKI